MNPGGERVARPLVRWHPSRTALEGIPVSDHPARITAARVLFSGPEVWINDELYVDVTAGTARLTRDTATLAPHSRLHTNTYFGRFEASYWRRWTGVREVTVEFTTAGDGEVTALLRASDIGAHARTIDTVVVRAGETVRLTGALDKFLDGGALWIEVRTGDGEVTLAAGRWIVDGGPRAGTPTHVAICTFNRADDCARTVSALASDPEVVAILDAVHVTDQGTDHVDSRDDYVAAAAILGARLRYRRQPNLGGAGGFSRGMAEATASGDDVNVLIMDDDVRVEPEAVLRLTALANAATRPILVGAQMLYLYNPDSLLISAEAADLPRLEAGQPADPFCLEDVSAVEHIQERRIDAQYNAWWSCLVPASVIAEVGFAMPYFFQWDDIEYALRCREAGYPTVTLPGAAVWHADFYWKDEEDFGKFFSLRNSLITVSMHGGATAREMTKEVTRRVLRAVASHQYGLAHTYLRAVEAFLEGPDTLEDGGREALARIREERDGYRETRRIDVGQLPPHITFARAPSVALAPGKEDLILAKRMLAQRLGRSAAGPVAISYEDSYWWHISLFDHAYVTDAGQNAIRELRRDPALVGELTARTARIARRLVREADAVGVRYRESLPRITGRENWARLFRD